MSEQPGAEPQWRMLHPLSVLVNLVPRAWGLVRQLWPFLLFAVVGGRADGAQLADLGIFFMFFVFAAVNTVLHWATLRYRLVGGRLEIESGLFQRNKRVIAPSAVQNVELVRNVFHRISGLVEVHIETASGEEVEGQLSALTVVEGQRLVDALSAARQAAPAPLDAAVVVQNDFFDLLRAGAASTRLGATLFTVFVLAETFGWVASPPGQPRVDLPVDLGAIETALALVLLALGTWLLGVVRTVVQHLGFTLRATGDTLVAESGLFTRRRVELPLHKVQVVRLRESVLRRLLGIGTLDIESASVKRGEGGLSRASTTVPALHPSQVPWVVRAVLPRLELELDPDRLLPPARRALSRALVRGAIQVVLLLVAAAVLAPSLTSVVLLVLSPLPLLAGWLDWRAQRWAVTDGYVVARHGFFDRVTTVVDRRRVQSVVVVDGPLLRRYGLARLVLRVAGSMVHMPLLEAERAYALAEALTLSGAGGDA